MANEIKPWHVPEVVWSAFCESIYKYGYGPHAIAAALNAWPGMECRPTFGPSRIILPLTEKPSDD